MKVISTTHTGLYVRHNAEGEIVSVQVLDSDGNSYSLKPELYLDRMIKPLIVDLPDEKDFQAAQ